MSRNLIRNSV